VHRHHQTRLGKIPAQAAALGGELVPPLQVNMTHFSMVSVQNLRQVDI